MKKLIATASFIYLFAFCKKNEVELNKVFVNHSIDKTNLLADGSSFSNIVVELPAETDVSKRGVVFSATNGTIVGAQQGKLIVKADFESGKLIAKARFKSSLDPGASSITIKPESVSPYDDYIIKEAIQLFPSLPKKIVVTASVLSIRTNFQTEISLKATVLNEQLKSVSSGTQVRFDDVFVLGGAVNGRYNSRIAFTNSDSSSVSTSFAVGNIAINTDIYIIGTVLENGQPTNIKDTILLTIVN